MERACLGAATATAVALIAGCGLVSQIVAASPPAGGMQAPSSDRSMVSRLALHVRKSRIRPANPLDGITQSTPLDGITQSTPLRTNLPATKGQGGSLAGTVTLGPISGDRNTQSLAQTAPSSPGGGVVALETPDGYLYVQDDKPLIVPVDGQGRFSFGSAVLPVGLPVTAAAFMTHRLRLTACAIIQPGTNSVQVTVGSTFASLYMQAQARLRGRPISTFDPTRWQRLVDLTDQAIASGSLRYDPADLDLQHQTWALEDYRDALSTDAALTEAWQSILGPAPAPTPSSRPFFGSPTVSVMPGI